MNEPKKPTRNEIIKQILLYDPEMNQNELKALSTGSLLLLWRQIELALSKLN
jgi:hypothetical protein